MKTIFYWLYGEFIAYASNVRYMHKIGVPTGMLLRIALALEIFATLASLLTLSGLAAIPCFTVVALSGGNAAHCDTSFSSLPQGQEVSVVELQQANSAQAKPIA